MVIHRPPRTATWLARTVALICVILALRGLAQAQDATKAPEARKAVDEKAIRALIMQLGDDAFEVREAAH
jgi:hypothetical protein